MSLAGLLARGPAVLTFYRGAWCPYCNADLRALQAALPAIEAAGASLVAISPQTAPNGRRAKRENGLGFPLLHDAGNAVAGLYGPAFAVSPAVRALYEGMGIDLARLNGDANWSLPMPSRFVIGRDGVVAYAEADPDYTRRPEPDEVVVALTGLRTPA